MRTVTFVGLLSAGLLAHNASAVSVDYRLEFDHAAGSFQLFATASADDNAGIACYGVALQGPITTLSHVSPYDPSAANLGQEYGAAGFTLLRSPNAGNGVFASQDTITPTPHLIYGLGQSSSSFSQLGLIPGAAASSTHWDGRLLLATGTFDSNIGLPSIDYGSVNTVANVFKSAGSSETMAANILGRPLPPLQSSPPVTPPSTPLVPPVKQPPSPPAPPSAPPVLTPSPPIADASVRYRIEFSDTPGEFKLFASASADGHAGIALYGVELTGPVTSLNHVSPATTAAQNTATEFGTSGFTLFRSDDGDTSVFGAQDTITVTPHLLYGIGQQAGSFAESGITPLAAAEGAEWGTNVLLATGTFDATLGSLGIDYDNTFANVFQSLDGTSTKAATIIEDPTLAWRPSSETPPNNPFLPPFQGPVDSAPTPQPPIEIPPPPTYPEIEPPPQQFPPIAEQPPVEQPPLDEPPAEPTPVDPAKPGDSMPSIIEIIHGGIIIDDWAWTDYFRPVVLNPDGSVADFTHIDLNMPVFRTGSLVLGSDVDGVQFDSGLAFDGALGATTVYTFSADGSVTTIDRLVGAVARRAGAHAAEAVIPEPSAYALAVAGLLGIASLRRERVRSDGRR